MKLHSKRVEKIGIIRSNEHNNLKFHDLREKFKKEICKVQQLLQSSPLETSVFQPSPLETSVIQSSPPEMSVVQTTSTETKMSESLSCQWLAHSRPVEKNKNTL